MADTVAGPASGRRVLVTAGASGIGLAIARAFLAGGARVHVCDIDEAALGALPAAAPGVGSSRCDMGNRAQIRAMVDTAVGALGGLDVLVNNAGIGGPTAPVEALDPDDWDRVLRVNVTSMFDTTRLAIPHLRRAGRGVVINLSSVAGRFGYANRAAYATSKWGVVGFTKSLSIELGPAGIRVNAILPGTVEGRRLDQIFEGRAKLSGRPVDEERRLAMTNQSIPSLVDAADIASLAVYLASDAGKAISGQALSIDNDMQRL
jgi:NAD(P)-dependent dehydrogenase (short-subunit alcohol dehydrogenase family)